MRLKYVCIVVTALWHYTDAAMLDVRPIHKWRAPICALYNDDAITRMRSYTTSQNTQMQTQERHYALPCASVGSNVAKCEGSRNQRRCIQRVRVFAVTLLFVSCSTTNSLLQTPLLFRAETDVKCALMRV